MFKIKLQSVTPAKDPDRVVTLNNGPIYNKSNSVKWNKSFSPTIFETGSTRVVISKEVYESYLSLLEFSKHISPDGTKGVCELPFVWFGQKETINGEQVFRITQNLIFPTNLTYVPQGTEDLDVEFISNFLATQNNNGVTLPGTPVITLNNCSNSSTTGGINTAGTLDDLLEGVDKENLVVCAGHTHPVMTQTSNSNFSPSPEGTNPETFGLGPRGYNFSSGDMNVWLGLQYAKALDEGVTVLPANICHNGDLNLLSYENGDPQMLRDVVVEGSSEQVQTSIFNAQARENFLNYIPQNFELEQ